MSDYVLSGPTWSGTTVSWYYSGNSGFLTEIAEAFARWDAVLGLDFVQATSAALADIDIGFAYIDGASNTLAEAYSVWSGSYYTGDSTITFDSAETWTYSAAAGSYVLSGGATFYAVALHEIGHAIGLDHPTNSSVIMSAYASAAVIDLTYWDIVGAQAMYGAETSVTAGVASISDVSITEGDGGTRLATFTVTRTGGTSAFALNFNTSDGSATSASGDYAATSGTLTFGAGVNSQQFSVVINGDTNVETDENFYAALSGATNGATINGQPGIGTIINDDGVVISDDYLGTTATSGTIAAGQTVAGVIEQANDHDWFAVQFNAGTTYTIQLTGGSLGDPYLALRDASGAQLDFNDDFGGTFDSQIVFQALASGTYFLDATGYGSGTGTYSVTLTATAAPGPGPAPGSGGSVLGTAANDAGLAALTGSDFADVIYGFGGNDELFGFGDNDDLIGGMGRDVMAGGSGADWFSFNSTIESRRGATHDVITDFQRGSDIVDLGSIDAKRGPGNQAFKFIAKQGFHHKAGELHYKFAGGSTIIEGDTNGDGRADFQIELSGHMALGRGDFIL